MVLTPPRTRMSSSVAASTLSARAPAPADKVEAATDDDILVRGGVSTINNHDTFLSKGVNDIVRIEVGVEQRVDQAGELVVGRVQKAGVHRAVPEQPGQANAARAVKRGERTPNVYPGFGGGKEN